MDTEFELSNPDRFGGLAAGQTRARQVQRLLPQNPSHRSSEVDTRLAAEKAKIEAKAKADAETKAKAAAAATATETSHSRPNITAKMIGDFLKGLFSIILGRGEWTTRIPSADFLAVLARRRPALCFRGAVHHTHLMLVFPGLFAAHDPGSNARALSRIQNRLGPKTRLALTDCFQTRSPTASKW